MDVIERFSRVVSQYGDKAAVHAKNEKVTFAELDSLSRKYASCFSRIAAPRVVVGYPQGTRAYAAMFGAMLCGGCYAPINSSAPRDKVASICGTFDPQVAVGTDAMLAEFAIAAPKALLLRSEEVDAAPVFLGTGARHQVAYVIFTSGSTGQPKGVMISHRAMSHYLDWVVSSKLFDPNDRVSQYTNIAFDVSVLDIFGSLCSGATIVPFVSRGDRVMPAQAVRREAVTVWVSVPSVISLMARANQLTAENMASVRRLFFAGEPLHETHCQGIFAAKSSVEIWNAYGPTETTVTMTWLPLTAASYASAVRSCVALGDCIPGMHVRLLGGPSANEGEIVIFGPQVADGYWNSPEQTQRVFRDAELDGVSTPAYFSGDWGRMVDGRLYFESRIDHQVKVNGYRIELNEVAAAIRSLGWREVVVLKLEGELTAIIEDKSGAEVSAVESDIHLRLQDKLDRYAIPSRILTLPEFPRTHNDKTDLKALAALAQPRPL
jgi:D-alanine--poly(phosphoribitol) ligase subunit 1